MVGETKVTEHNDPCNPLSQEAEIQPCDMSSTELQIHCLVVTDISILPLRYDVEDSVDLSGLYRVKSA